LPCTELRRIRTSPPSRIAFVENQVDDRLHRGLRSGRAWSGGTVVRNAASLDLAVWRRTAAAPGSTRTRTHVRSRGRQPAERAQSESDLPSRLSGRCNGGRSAASVHREFRQARLLHHSILARRERDFLLHNGCFCRRVRSRLLLRSLAVSACLSAAGLSPPERRARPKSRSAAANASLHRLLVAIRGTARRIRRAIIAVISRAKDHSGESPRLSRLRASVLPMVLRGDRAIGADLDAACPCPARIRDPLQPTRRLV